MDNNVLTFEEAAVWALYYKEKYGKSRKVSIEEIKEYAKEVKSLCKDMFDFKIEFKMNPTDIKKLIATFPTEMKYVESKQLIRLKTYSSTKWLIADVASKRPVVLELDRALSDHQIARKVFGPKEREME